MPNIGEIAPDFELVSDKRERIKLSSFRGKKVILYFYPKAGTSG
jgi:peroxiredoxin Q/BCP